MPLQRNWKTLGSSFDPLRLKILVLLHIKVKKISTKFSLHIYVIRLEFYNLAFLSLSWNRAPNTFLGSDEWFNIDGIMWRSCGKSENLFLTWKLLKNVSRANLLYQDKFAPHWQFILVKSLFGDNLKIKVSLKVPTIPFLQCWPSSFPI